MSPQQIQELNARIGWLLDQHLAPIFKPGTQLTFIARTPGNDEADVLVTTERDINEVVALALRSLGRHSVGQGVDTVPSVPSGYSASDIAREAQWRADYKARRNAGVSVPGNKCIPPSNTDAPETGGGRTPT